MSKYKVNLSKNKNRLINWIGVGSTSENKSRNKSLSESKCKNKVKFKVKVKIEGKVNVI